MINRESEAIKTANKKNYTKWLSFEDQTYCFIKMINVSVVISGAICQGKPQKILE